MKWVYVCLFTALIGMTGCSPEVGSPEWCEEMDKKAKGDWSANDAAEYAKNCIFRSSN
nr:DUF3012 domain-containing protein [Photobacterium aquae]